MKYLKTFEKFEIDVKIGDYVVVKLQRIPKCKTYDKLIGKLIEITGHQYRITYSNIINDIYVYDNEIVYASRNKTDCELYLKNKKLYSVTNKYNL